MAGLPGRRLVLASGNAGKLKEFNRLLRPMGFDVIAQAALQIPEAEEPHPTFVENALAKARHASRLSGLPALADDSGICVEALNGAPGVHSARFAGEPRSDERNNDLLLERLRHASDRSAHYYCVLVLIRNALDPEPLIAEGIWRGEVGLVRRGNGGFSYDPLFVDRQLGQTGAEMDLETKNRLSHRGQAMERLMALIRQYASE
ncbi:MAG: RdgB/HAM1 family non-canonical purine NTP pyrophosphatase [Betaproteobacteria bacterium]|nr:RdgB/HAM1 family non-canonical purine NTP pyrophosphatase [Betaproteobacteria bacterium]